MHRMKRYTAPTLRRLGRMSAVTRKSGGPPNDNGVWPNRNP